MKKCEDLLDVANEIQLQNNLGADTRTRTGDLFITNELLYQLSHIGLNDSYLLLAFAKVGLIFEKTKYFIPYFYSQCTDRSYLGIVSRTWGVPVCLCRYCRIRRSPCSCGVFYDGSLFGRFPPSVDRHDCRFGLKQEEL